MLTGIAARLAFAALATVAVALAGCGSAPVSELPPAAEPDTSPPLETQPAGRVVRVGNQPEGVVADPVTGLVAVGVRDPAELALVDGGTGRVRSRVAPSDAPRHLVPHDAVAVDGGRALAVVSARERVLELYDSDTLERIGRAPAGAGPTHVVAGEGGLAYVVDTAGDGLLVFETRGELRILRRYPLLGAPYGVASDLRNGRLWVTLTARNELVELATSARPHRLGSYPTVRQPNAVAVDPASGRVFVTGTVDGVLQLLDPRRSR